jgi:diaminopimelate epimerase
LWFEPLIESIYIFDIEAFKYMKIPFFKFHGALNDFVLLDGRTQDYSTLGTETVAQICDRHAGIGGDGLIILEIRNNKPYMKYFNSDGGGRCFTAFCHMLGICDNELLFDAIDGPHRSLIIARHSEQQYTVKLEMKNVDGFTSMGDDCVVDTGSPHYVSLCENLVDMDVVMEGKRVRNSPDFKEKGTKPRLAELEVLQLLSLPMRRDLSNQQKTFAFIPWVAN